jgi:hypothetical protein
MTAVMDFLLSDGRLVFLRVLQLWQRVEPLIKSWKIANPEVPLRL